jgi:hypothetical protein
MNFLELCQAAARDSGVVSGARPTTVVGQTGTEGKLVAYVADAWNRIQNLHTEWLWMQKEFSKTITSAEARYSATDLGITDWSEWLLPTMDGERRFTIYKDSLGVSDEHPLIYTEFHRYLRIYETGSQTASSPAHFSVAPDGKLCFGPQPDANHTVKGFYRKANQVLAANADTPEMPSRFHTMIKNLALLLFAEHDEAVFSVAAETRQYKEQLSALEVSQLFRGKKIDTAGPLA